MNRNIEKTQTEVPMKLKKFQDLIEERFSTAEIQEIERLAALEAEALRLSQKPLKTRRHKPR